MRNEIAKATTGSCGAQQQLRPLDVQFALTVAGDEHPAATLAAALR
ncbi:hypothetical protein [Streptomyces sp. WAC00276]